jgi:hypothetical protein
MTVLIGNEEIEPKLIKEIIKDKKNETTSYNDDNDNDEYKYSECSEQTYNH